MRKKKAEDFASAKVIKTRKWIMEEKTYDNGRCVLVRTNDGFSTLELLGLADLAKNEIIGLMKGEQLRVDTIERQRIVEKP